MPTCPLIMPYHETRVNHRPLWSPKESSVLDWYQPRATWISRARAVVQSDLVLEAPSHLATELDATLAIIREAGYIVNLPVDWDDEDGPRYSGRTLDRATDLLYRFASTAYAQASRIGVPDISPADDGSIDLFWKNEVRQLLINVPAADDEDATYFGQNRRGDTIAGPLQTNTIRADLIQWLKQKI